MDSQMLFRYNPDMYPPETLEKIFVQREDLARQLVEDTRESVLTAAKHYSLLIGARGFGKTHLVAVVYHRLKQLEELHDPLVIAWTREEEWGITCFLDLLMRILRTLAEAPEEEAAELKQQMEELYEHAERPEIAEELAGELLRDYLDDRTLLVILENLDDLFAGLGEDGQRKFRAYLQNRPFCTIIATSQSLFNGVSSRSEPFYGFFKVRHLPELSAEDAAELLAKLAALRGDSELASFIRTPIGQARVNAIHFLAGGNHRIYVMLSELLTQESLNELTDAFLGMLDELTPFFQARMQYLSPQQRKIVEVMCERRHPLAVKEIARACFITHQTASGQLKQLREMRYVRARSLGRQSFYELQEPLMRLCHQRNAARGEPIRLFVEFLRIWYTRDELHDRLQAFPTQETMDHCYLSEALRAMPVEADAAIFKAYDEEIQEHVRKEDWAGLQKLADELIADRGTAPDFELAAYAAARQENYQQALALAEKAIDLYVAADGEEMVAFAWGVRGEVLGLLGRYEEAVASYDRALELDPEFAIAWDNRGGALGMLGRYEEALLSCDRALELDRESAGAWCKRGAALDKLGRHTEAVASYDRALELGPEDSLAWASRGSALEALGRHEEAIASYDRAVEFDAENPATWTLRGVALARLRRQEEALASWDRAIECDPSFVSAALNKARLCLTLGRVEDSMSALDYALRTARERDDVPPGDIEYIILPGIDVVIGQLPPARWRAIVERWVELFAEYDLMPNLAVSLAGSVRSLVAPEVSDATAGQWRDLWQEVGAQHEALALALRMLDVTVRWREAQTERDKERVLLELPAEERKFLRPLLGLEEEDDRTQT